MLADENGPGLVSAFQAFLIVPKYFTDEYESGNLLELWLRAGMNLVAEESNINVADVFVKSAAEVTSADLKDFWGRTTVQAVLSSALGNHSLVGKLELAKNVTGGPAAALGSKVANFPKNTDELIAGGFPFNVVIVQKPLLLCLFSVDGPESRRSGSVCLAERRRGHGLGYDWRFTPG